MVCESSALGDSQMHNHEHLLCTVSSTVTITLSIQMHPCGDKPHWHHGNSCCRASLLYPEARWVPLLLYMGPCVTGICRAQ